MKIEIGGNMSPPQDRTAFVHMPPKNSETGLDLKRLAMEAPDSVSKTDVHKHIDTIAKTQQASAISTAGLGSSDAPKN